jgi:hypothetical protein
MTAKGRVGDRERKKPGRRQVKDLPRISVAEPLKHAAPCQTTAAARAKLQSEIGSLPSCAPFAIEFQKCDNA